MNKYTKIISILIFLYGAVSMQAQNRISIELEEFDALYVSGRLDVELIPSDSREMSITAQNGQPGDVDVEIKGGQLRIKIRPRLNKDEIFAIQVPYKVLQKIESHAGAVINSARDLETESIILEATTGGKIELGLEVKQITALISQVSDIILYGKAESQNVTVNTGGNYLAYDLDCMDTFIKVSSGSQGKVKSTRRLEATSNSKGFIGYMGNPEHTIFKSSLGGEITKVEEEE